MAVRGCPESRVAGTDRRDACVAVEGLTAHAVRDQRSVILDAPETVAFLAFAGQETAEEFRIAAEGDRAGLALAGIVGPTFGAERALEGRTGDDVSADGNGAHFASGGRRGDHGNRERGDESDLLHERYSIVPFMFSLGLWQFSGKSRGENSPNVPGWKRLVLMPSLLNTLLYTLFIRVSTLK